MLVVESIYFNYITLIFLILQYPTANISSGLYDQRDLVRLDRDDAYARCYLRTLLSNGDISKSVDVLDSAFKFRKEVGIWGECLT